jgi:integrase
MRAISDDPGGVGELVEAGWITWHTQFNLLRAGLALISDVDQADRDGVLEGKLGPQVRASVLIASGANPKVIQRIMGHATIQMTFDQYGHLMPDGLDEAAKRANEYLVTALGQ